MGGHFILTALLLALAGPVFAQDQIIPQSFRDFRGGYVDTIESASLPPEASPSAHDVVIDDPIGALKPRLGFDRCGNTPTGSAATNLYQFFKSDGTRNLIATDNTNVWSTRDCITFTTITTAGNANSQFYFTTVRDKVWMVNGSTWPITWDGSTATLLDGRAGTPSGAPKCAYPEFWHERFWCGRSNAYPSGVYFSALFDSIGNDIDPSTNTVAFPAINVFQIDQNGGSPVYAVKAYRDRLYVFKDNGIWELQFNSEYDNAVRKTGATVGSRFNTAISEVDGILYFVGKDGIYAFDGDNAARISEPIQNKFYELNQPQIGELTKTWTTQGDFTAAGTAFSSTTATGVPGDIVISTQAGLVDNGDFATGTLSSWDSSKIIGDAATQSAHISTFTYGGYDGARIRVYPGSGSAGCETNATGRVRIFNVSGSTLTNQALDNTNGVVTAYSLDTSANLGTVGRAKFSVVGTQAVPSAVTNADLWSTTFTIGANFTFTYATIEGVYCGFNLIDDVKAFQYFSSGTWTSEPYNAISVSSWTTFEVTTQEDNGSSISYEVRVGTNAGGLEAASYTAIAPGSSINASTQTHIQFRASLFASSNKQTTPHLEDLTVGYSQGGVAANKIYMAGWKNRVWISASSGTTTTNNLVLVKSRLPLNSWIPYNLQLGPMVNFNDAWYAAASTHSAIYRMDYGNTDDGVAIDWEWTTKDATWNNPNFKKYLRAITVDFVKDTAANGLLTYSSDYGVSFTTGPVVNMSGTGRGSSRRNVSTNNTGLSYRFKIGSRTLGESATVTGITGWGEPFKQPE